MSVLRRRRFRWPLELVVVLVVLPFVLQMINDQRTCTSDAFGLPVTCDNGWISSVMLVALFGVVLAEAVAAVTMSRRCPRCGRRVPTGRLDCRCGFDFNAIGR